MMDDCRLMVENDLQPTPDAGYWMLVTPEIRNLNPAEIGGKTVHFLQHVVGWEALSAYPKGGRRV
jgi:hypothetical protein